VTILDADGALVTVRARTPRATHGLELRGELPCWQQPIAMEPDATLRLGAGVYEVKVREPNGSWWIDPAWRTVVREGETNGAIVVGGSEEPVLHAPSEPWLVCERDGRVIVRAGLRGGSTLRLRFDDGSGFVTKAMRAASACDSHTWLELELGGAGRSLEYGFVLADGRLVGDASGAMFRVTPRAADAPAWWQGAIVYTIFVDRFRAKRDVWERDARAGGDLDGVVASIPYLVSLGVNTLHLTPVCEAPSPHRYDAIDPRAVDPALGGEAAFARLIDRAHAHGLRVIVDVAATHVHRDFAPFRDVRARGPASPYWRWFRATRWPFVDGQDPGYAHYQKGQWQEPLLATDEPEVQAWIAETFACWVRRGADGVRVDAAADLPLPLIRSIRAAVRAVNRDAIVFGEVVPSCLDRFVPHALDAATDFAPREAMIAWLRGELPARAVARVFDEQRRRGVASARGLAFVGTHDQPRIETIVRDPALARLGLVASILGARVPMIYYGDELGLSSSSEHATRDFEDSWPDRQPMPWDEASWDHATHAAVKDAIALRAREEIFRLGDEHVIARGDDILVLRRTLRDQTVELVLDRATRAYVIEDHRAPIDPALIEHNAAIARHAFTEGHAVCPAYPSRLYVTVTDACNLRCAHCITDAPARTQSGRARALQPWLLDALDDAFAHADYVAFTHGGESLSAPIFPEVVRRVASRSHGRAKMHLVTNGTLLDEERVRMLIDHGVTSIMISLDGATAATNDRIRVLGRFDRVVEHVARAIELREQLGADLRLGISTVVGATNVGELPALGRLCAALGVDWLKVEETYPATPFARHDLLAPDAPAIRAALSALRDVLAPTKITLVDHLAPPIGCACVEGGDARVSEFRRADDFANRATFRPCRAAWEQAAIDPDGTMHVVDYAGARLGNLLDAPFLTLWNAPAALDARQVALAATTPARRVRCTTA